MKVPTIEIFVIDDDPEFIAAVGLVLQHNKIENVTLFTRYEDLLKALKGNAYICIVDYQLRQNLDGIELIKKIVKENNHCWFIMLSGEAEKRVIIEFLNCVYGSRFIDKGDVNIYEKLIGYIKDITKQIHSIYYLIYNYYSNVDIIKEGFTDLKKLVKNDC